MFKFDKSMLGRKVRFTNVKAHEEMPEYYPKVGTVGIVVPVECTIFEDLVDDFEAQWPKETPSWTDIWT